MKKYNLKLIIYLKKSSTNKVTPKIQFMNPRPITNFNQISQTNFG